MKNNSTSLHIYSTKKVKEDIEIQAKGLGLSASKYLHILHEMAKEKPESIIKFILKEKNERKK